MRTANILTHEEIGFDYDICNAIWNMGCGDDIDGRMVDIGFWKSVLSDEDMIENFEGEELEIVGKMLEVAKRYKDEVLVELK